MGEHVPRIGIRSSYFNMEESDCYHCKKRTSECCKHCQTFFCSRDCMKAVVEEHISFCRTLVKKKDESKSTLALDYIKEQNVPHNSALGIGSAPFVTQAAFTIFQNVKGTFEGNTRFTEPVAPPYAKKHQIIPGSRFQVGQDALPVVDYERKVFTTGKPYVQHSESNERSESRIMNRMKYIREKDNHFKKTDSININDELKVTCFYAEDGGWWVMPEFNRPQYLDIVDRMKNIIFCPLTAVTDNLVCGFRYREMCHRVQILNTSPIRIRFIDFGLLRNEILQEELTEIPQDLQLLPQTIIFMKFATGYNIPLLLENAITNVVVVGQCNNGFLVRPKEEGDGKPELRVPNQNETIFPRPNHDNRKPFTPRDNRPNSGESNRGFGQSERPNNYGRTSKPAVVLSSNGSNNNQDGNYSPSKPQFNKKTSPRAGFEHNERTNKFSRPADMHSNHGAHYNGEEINSPLKQEFSKKSSPKASGGGFSERTNNFERQAKSVPSTNVTYNNREESQSPPKPFFNKKGNENFEGSARAADPVNTEKASPRPENNDSPRPSESDTKKSLPRPRPLNVRSEDGIKSAAVQRLSLGTEQDLVRFPSGCVVLIQNIHNVYKVSITKVDEGGKYNELQDRINRIRRFDSPMDSPPKVGDIIAAPYIDNVFYRGRIEKLFPNEAVVYFIDYGNTHTVAFDNLRSLPPDIVDVQEAAITVTLKDIPNTNEPGVTEALRFLHEVQDNLTQITMTYEGSIDNGVIFTANGTNYNEQLIRKLSSFSLPGVNPVDSIEDNASTQDIKLLEIVEGVHDLIVLYADENVDQNGIVYCNNAGSPVVGHVLCTLNNQLSEYIKLLTIEAYLPKDDCCAALFDGQWYRAMVLNKLAANKFEVYFVDFGNTAVVDSKNLRPIPAEFTKTPFIASKCKIVGISDNIKESQRVKIRTFLASNDTLKSVKVTKNETDYSIVVPDIEMILSEN